jgi:hypothetical protein
VKGDIPALILFRCTVQELSDKRYIGFGPFGLARSKDLRQVADDLRDIRKMSNKKYGGNGKFINYLNWWAYVRTQRAPCMSDATGKRTYIESEWAGGGA